MRSVASKRIAILLKTDVAVKRDALRGICEFQREHAAHWQIELLPQVALRPRWMLPQGVDGVITWPDTEAQTAWLEQLELPVIILGHAERHIQPRVRIDNSKVGARIARYFRERGLSHFAAYCERNLYQYSQDRWRGFSDEVSAGGGEAAFYAVGPEVEGIDWMPLEAQARLGRWLHGLPKPIGILADRDLAGYDLLQACRFHGIRVPDEVAVVSVGADDLLGEIATPLMSSVVLPGRRMGWEAGRMMDGLLKRKKRPADVVIDKFVLHERGSSDVFAGEDEAVVRALRFIRDRANEGVGVEEVVRAAAVSRRSLEVRFLRTTGRTIHRALMAVRLDAAQRLLESTDMTLAEVADHCGYRELARLSEAFVRATGLPPAAWRKQAKRGRGPALGMD